MRCEGFGCSETLEDGRTILGCDTIYAVDKSYFSKKWLPITQITQLIDILDSYTLPRAVDIVLTGGEPLLNMDNHIFTEFLEIVHKRGHRICFETNGSLSVNFEKYPIYKKCLFALSVKLSNSNEPLKKRVSKDILQSIALNAKDSFFKFSIADSLLESEIEQIVSYAPNIDVYCMPLGDSKAQIEKNSPKLVEFCKLKGYNFGDRLHIRIWDKERGI